MQVLFGVIFELRHGGDGGKKLENQPYSWDIPTVQTVKADSKKRVRLPDAEPGQVFACETTGEGQFKLTLVKAVTPDEDHPAKVTFVKEGDFTVGVTDRPIDMEALREALADFP
jgi:hypothetical protein